MTLDGGDAVTIEWPEGIAELEEFVRSKGLHNISRVGGLCLTLGERYGSSTEMTKLQCA